MKTTGTSIARLHKEVLQGNLRGLLCFAGVRQLRGQGLYTVLDMAFYAVKTGGVG